MGSDYWKAWWKAAGIRAGKTFAEAALSILAGGYAGILEVDWIAVVSVSALAAVIALLTCVRGIPELPIPGEEE